MVIASYARGIPTYKGENGQTIGLLCETKEQCITDDDGVRLSDKLASMQEQIGEGPVFTGLATESYVDASVSGLAAKTYVDDAVDGLASESYVSNAVKDLATKEELEEYTGSQVTQTVFNNHANNSTFHITAAERISWNAKVDADELEEAVEGIESDIANIVNGTTKVGKASHADSATTATTATKATTADSATKAASDGAGNNIVDTYSTKVEVEAILAGLESGETATGDAAALGGETATDWQNKIDAKVPNTRTVNGKALSDNVTLSASDVGADASGSASSALTSAKAYTDAEVATLETVIGTKANQTALDTHAGNTTVHITTAERTAWNGKVSQTELQTAVSGITSGTIIAAKATDADKLDGNDSLYFATAASVTNIVNGTTKVGSASVADTATNATRATSADTATSDGDGNNIAGTYIKKSAVVVTNTDPGVGASVSYANGTLLFVKGA